VVSPLLAGNLDIWPKEANLAAPSTPPKMTDAALSLNQTIVNINVRASKWFFWHPYVGKCDSGKWLKSDICSTTESCYFLYWQSVALPNF
jgi:hypothetical protein